ncbi:MAG TPA: Hpt domain-containing protein [Vicinamibacterales bacterium]|nr:Hpt domain-containing protein [Vicinamibacterales bacterium]
MPSEAADQSAAIDWARVRMLRELQDEGAPDLMAQLVALFEEGTTTRLAGARKALRDGDFRSLRREAHSLKGSAGMIGANALREAAARLEREAECENPVAASAALGAVEAEAATARSALSNGVDIRR